jgi:hypothetical protein
MFNFLFCFFGAISHFDWPITKKKLKLRRSTNTNFYSQDTNIQIYVVALWPMYVGEKRTTLDKSYGIKMWCY